MKGLKRTSLMALMMTLLIVSIALASGAVKFFNQRGETSGIKLADDLSQDVNVQDQTTVPMSLRLSNINDLTMTLAEPPTVNSYNITLSAGHSVIAGEQLSIIYDEGSTVKDGQHLMTSEVLSVATNVLTMDEPVPYAFPVDSIIYTSTQAMNVNGSVTPVIFQLTNAYSIPADLTQIVFHITDDAAMDDTTFGALTKLTRGCVFRKAWNNGTMHYKNYFNAKDNGDLGELAGPEGKAYDDKRPSGEYGFSAKISYSGQANYGVAIRLMPGQSIQLIIQDNLTGLLSFTGYAQGHFTN
jgi:hypothetical protein